MVGQQQIEHDNIHRTRLHQCHTRLSIDHWRHGKTILVQMRAQRCDQLKITVQP